MDPGDTLLSANAAETQVTIGRALASTVKAELSSFPLPMRQATQTALVKTLYTANPGKVGFQTQGGVIPLR